MANGKEVSTLGEIELKKAVEITKQELKQVQKVMDLETGNEDATITIVQTKFVAPAYSEEVYGGTEELFNAELFKAATALIQPISKQVDAMLYRATQDSYQSGKDAALKGGNFLTQDLRGKIVQVMRGSQAFADLSAKDALDYWKKGYMDKKPGAVKVLQTAQALGGFEEF